MEGARVGGLGLSHLQLRAAAAARALFDTDAVRSGFPIVSACSTVSRGRARAQGRAAPGTGALDTVCARGREGGSRKELLKCCESIPSFSRSSKTLRHSSGALLGAIRIWLGSFGAPRQPSPSTRRRACTPEGGLARLRTM